MNGAKRIKITDLNPHLICVLCGGYFIDATTLTECPHSFCKKCIIKYLETSKHCPVCDVMVHKTRPHMNIRSDKTLQDLVYKLVPGLYKNEMKRRREYYRQNPHAAPKKVGEDRGDEMAERIIYTEDENFSLALHFCSEGVKDERTVRNLTLPEVGASSKEAPKNVRYLQSPAGVTIGILKKFIRLKYELLSRFQIDIFHTDEALHDDLTLMDIAYIYTWRRKEPLRLNYTVYECAIKKMRLNLEPKREKSSGTKGALKEEYKPQVKNHTQMSVKQTYKQSSKQVTGQISKIKQVTEPTSKQCTVVPAKQGAIPATTKPEMKEAVKEETKSELKLNGKDCSKQVEKEIKKVNKKAIIKQHTKPLAKEEIRPPTKKPCKVNGILQDGSTVLNKTSTGLILSPTKKMAGGAKPKKSTSGVKILQSLAPQMTTTTTNTTTNTSTNSRTQTKTPSNVQEPSSQTSTLNTLTSSEIPVARATLTKENNSGTKCSNTDKDQKAGIALVMEVGASSASDGTSASRTTAQQQQQLMLSNVSLITSAASSASSFTSTTATTASTVQAADPGAAKPSPSPMASETKAEDGDAKVTSASLPPVPSRQLTPTTAVTTMNNINTGTSSEADAAGAAGASDAVQAPAALAASSSPSPPMGSTASSVKEQSLTSSSLPTQTSLPLTTSTKPLPVSAASARPSSANPSLPLAPKATVVSQKSRVHDFSIVSKTITTDTGTSSCSAPLSSGVSGRSDEVTGESPSKSNSSSVALENLNSHGSSVPAAAASSSAKTMANKISIDDCNDINTISSSSRVPVGSPTVISTVNSVTGSSGRVCNGMPPVVTRMMRVSNASTSVNTLPKTYQTNAGQQTRPSSRTPVAIQPAVAVVTASSTLPSPLSLPMTTSHTSLPIIPMTTSYTSMPVVPTTHSLVRTSAGSAIAVAMAKRASELQHLKLQQQQQQMYEQQRLHLLQQQQQQNHLMNIQAAAVRWTAQQVTAPVSRIPASPTSSSALVGSSSPKMASSPRAETPAAKSPDAESPKRAGSGQLQQVMLNKKSADVSSKKKISDIANSLHKKVSQTCNNQKHSESPSVLKRPPNAHSANNNNKRLESGPGQGHARRKDAVVCDSGMDRQDEPLNLVTRNNKDSPRSSTGLVQVSITG